MRRSGETGSRRFDPGRWQRLLSPERYALLDPVAFLQLIGVAQGSTVADLGAGPGFRRTAGGDVSVTACEVGNFPDAGPGWR
jgi:hypothetical protein